MPGDCIFCRIVAGEAPADIIYENEHVVAFHDIHPAAATHVLIVPRKHLTSIAAVEESDKALMGELLYAARRVAEQLGVDSAFRLVINNGSGAGQSVFHLHVHLLAGRVNLRAVMHFARQE
jgi:histidine triad (HIT) family protein